MKQRIVQTTSAPAAIGPYSQGIAAGEFLFVSGQLGLAPASGELAGPEFGQQARQALANLGAILAAGGSGLDQVVAVDVYLTDMEKFTEFNGIYAEFFGDHKPARAVVEVSRLPRNALVEIKCTAICGMDTWP
ncbi:MAG: RidA family protein [Thermodesulfobacteriota bacterium]